LEVVRFTRPGGTTHLQPLVDVSDLATAEQISYREWFSSDKGTLLGIVDCADDGVYLQIRDVALFQPGNAEIESSTAWIVDQLGEITLGVDVPVTVAGRGGRILPGGT